MEQSCMVIDSEGNVISAGHPDCIEKRRKYWEDQGYTIEKTNKEEAVRRYQEYLKNNSDFSQIPACPK